MKRNKTNLLILFVMLTMSFAGRAQTALAQNALAPQNPHNDVKTDSRILYHNGPVLSGAQDIYLIWYGCWANDCGFAGDTASQFILSDFMSSLGSTPYFQINAGYPNSSGQAPSGGLFFGGSAVDRFYSHGLELTAEDIQGIVSDQILAGVLPL
ncbi:MAG TPA: hypothetical protein VIJ87_03765, partial [Pyrinomonadaceae bacterium]